MWGLKVEVGSDGPYWSLGYEVWYYVIFGVALLAPSRWRVAGTIAAVIIAGPRIVVLFPLWLAGLGSWWLRAHGWPRRVGVQRLLLLLPVVELPCAAPRTKDRSKEKTKTDTGHFAQGRLTSLAACDGVTDCHGIKKHSRKGYSILGKLHYDW